MASAQTIHTVQRNHYLESTRRVLVYPVVICKIFPKCLFGRLPFLFLVFVVSIKGLLTRLRNNTMADILALTAHRMHMKHGVT